MNIPTKVKEQKLKKGEIMAQHSRPVSVIMWNKKKTVAMICTFQ
jgi:hypothetical protein